MWSNRSCVERQNKRYIKAARQSLMISANILVILRDTRLELNLLSSVFVCGLRKSERNIDTHLADTLPMSEIARSIRVYRRHVWNSTRSHPTAHRKMPCYRDSWYSIMSREQEHRELPCCMPAHSQLHRPRWPDCDYRNCVRPSVLPPALTSLAPLALIVLNDGAEEEIVKRRMRATKRNAVKSMPNQPPTRSVSDSDTS